MGHTRGLVVLFSAITAAIISGYFFAGFLGPTEISTILNLPIRGNVKTIGVGIYWNANCISNISSIDWGIMEPGSSKNMTIYVRNEGNAEMILSFNTTNWTPPESSQHISISWDYDGRSIRPNEVIRVTIAITIWTTIGNIKSYAFDLQIKGTS